MKKFRYKNVILYTTHQWCGNTLNYFIETSQNLLVFLLMPRVQNKDNVIRIYKKGKLIKEENISLSENFFLYYLMWYLHYIRALFLYFSSKDPIIIVTAHPYIFLGMLLQKVFRKIIFVYWIGDYFPPLTPTLRIFEMIKKFYHDRIHYTFYLGDGVNKIMNGRIVNESNKKTVMWGVKPKKITRNLNEIDKSILHVGVIRNSSGLDVVYDLLKKHKDYKLTIIGVCDDITFSDHKKIINDYKIADRVFFPNRFYSDEELDEISKKSFVGVATYTIDKSNVIYYSDPGKVKTYAEMNLPIIMSNTSMIAPYISKYKAGEVIERDVDSLFEALEKIRANYKDYLKGLAQFNKHFYYKTYYNDGFKSLVDVS